MCLNNQNNDEYYFSWFSQKIQNIAYELDNIFNTPKPMENLTLQQEIDYPPDNV